MAVITLSRQLGSLGDEIAQLVCDKLGYQRFDKKVMAQLGIEKGMNPKAIADAIDFTPAAHSLLERWFGSTQRLTGGDPSSWTFSARNDALEGLTAGKLVELINAGYEKGNVVIVGRGSMAALQGKPDVLHVRITAPVELRIKRVVEKEHCSVEEARQKVQHRDVTDVEWIKRYFDLDSHDPKLFDLIINTTKISPEAAADMIVKALSAIKAK